MLFEEISKMDENVLVCLIEAVYNILSGKLGISTKMKRKLRPHVSHLRTLSQIQLVPKARRFMVQQGGAILPALLPVLIASAAEILRHVL
jgi:hypothetical protein